MEMVTIENLELDRCIACNGIWFDEFELADFKEIKGSESVDIGNSSIGRKQNENDLIKCPKCDSRMIRMVDANKVIFGLNIAGRALDIFSMLENLKI